MNLVVLWSARVCREGWDKSMFGQLETEQEAEEGQPWLQGERKETQMCPAVRLSGQQNTAHPSWVVSVSQSALAACQEGRSPHQTGSVQQGRGSGQASVRLHIRTHPAGLRL